MRWGILTVIAIGTFGIAWVLWLLLRRQARKALLESEIIGTMRANLEELESLDLDAFAKRLYAEGILPLDEPPHS